jgi:uncharacterized protein
MKLAPYFLIGTVFGAVVVEAQVVSWFRVQEMFRFDAFHMYGVIGAAVATASISLLALRRLGLRGPDGAPLGFAPKTLGRGVRYGAGGVVFGIGWALTGACPGPLVALTGAGMPVMLVALISAIAGTWTYGFLRRTLPH